MRDAGDPDADVIYPEGRTEYEFDLVCKKDNEVPFADSDDLYVIRNMCFDQGFVFSNFYDISFATFVQHMKRPTRRTTYGERTHTTRAPPRDLRAELLAANPWMDEEDLAFVQLGPRSGRAVRRRLLPGAEVDSEEDEVDSEADSENSELDIAEEAIDVAADLAELRAGTALEGAEEAFFYVQVRGGRWTAKNKGVVADSAMGRARGGMATSWCKVYDFPRMKVFSFSRHTPEGALEMAREYCRRAHYFFKFFMDCEEGWEEFTYNQAHLDGYTWHLDWLNFMCELPEGCESFKRGTEVQEICPRLG